MITKACVIFRSKFEPNYDIVIPCHWHGDVFEIISYILRRRDIDYSRTEQGFLNENGEFLNRYEAYREAVRCRRRKNRNFFRRICGEKIN